MGGGGGGGKEEPEGVLVPSPITVTATHSSKPNTDQYQFPFIAFDEGERCLFTWFLPAGIDRDASRFQGLDAILDWHT